MTCLDKLKRDHPDDYSSIYENQCPYEYGYLNESDVSDDCSHGLTCYECWDREAVENRPTIKDSGNRREFETGAVRDICEGKGRCDLMPLDIVATLVGGYGEDELRRSIVLIHLYEYQITGDSDVLFQAIREFGTVSGITDMHTLILEVAKQFEDGAKKYGEYNWQKGIPTHCYIDSAIRHYLKFLRGDKDEPHDRAFVWNIICCIWTCANKPELNDYPREESMTNESHKAEVH